MLYLNCAYSIWHKVTKRYHINGISLGSDQQKQSNIFVPTERGIGRRLHGLRRDLTIGKTKSGNPRINRTPNTEMYLILSSRQTNPSLQRYYASHGHVLAPAEQNNSVLAVQGDPTSIWYDAIVQAAPGDIFMVQPPTPEKHPTQIYYLVDRDCVIEVLAANAEDAYRSLLSKLHQQRDCLREGLQPWTWRDTCRRCGHNLTKSDF